jgi:hypothetical protein
VTQPPSRPQDPRALGSRGLDTARRPARLASPGSRLGRRFFRFATALAITASCATASGGVETFPFEQLKPGLRGTLETVISGAERESLQLEILGVQSDGIGPGIPLVLCRLIDERGQWTGVAAGMSGSPVTIDGRLVGALSYSVGAFTREPICGITPIDSMLALEDYPGGRRADPRDAPAATAGASRIPLMLAGIGLAPGTAERDGDLWERITAGGWVLAPSAAGAHAAAGPAAANALLPGSAVSALLVWGDVRIGATGTVTWREGDAVLAFGHPFLGSGRTALPIAPASIVWTVPSMLSSFKIAEIGRPVGTLTQDRLTAVKAELGAVPEGVPLAAEVRRERHPPHRVAVQIARDPLLLPILSDLVVRQAVAQAIGLEAAEALKMRASIRLADGRMLDVVHGGGGARGQSAVQILGSVLSRRLAMLDEAPFAMPEIEGISVDIEAVEPEGAWTIARALPDRTAVRPGESIRVVLDLEGPRGLHRRDTLSIEVPADVRPGSYVLFAGSEAALGGEFGALEEARRRTARNADDYLSAISVSASPLVLGLRLAESSEGLVANGREYLALPGTAYLMLRSRPGGHELYRSRWLPVAEAGLELDRPITNLKKTTVSVLPPETAR